MTNSSLRTTQPDLHWQENGFPSSTRFNDVYFSDSDPLEESTHVFINGNRLLERWEQQPEANPCFTIAELGFGTGLNFLNCWQHWQKLSTKHAQWRKLHYIGLECLPITAKDMHRVHSHWPILDGFSKQLLDIYDSESTGWHRFLISEDVTLDLFLGDAEQELASRSLENPKIDAWFLDGFSPDRNASLWQSSLFELVAQHSHRNTSIATYSSAGSVRRSLEKVGFNVVKAKGFGRKRHMLLAQGLNPDINNQPHDAHSPWFCYPVIARGPVKSDQNAIVIGSGLAGANAANALARRGFQITVIDKSDCVGGGASRIPQLALRCRLFNQTSSESLFYLQAYLFALRHYAALNSQSSVAWHECGVVQLPDAMNRKHIFDRNLLTTIYPDNVLQTSLPESHKHSICPEQAKDALWFPRGGWIDSKVACNALLRVPNITTQYGVEVASVKKDNGVWRVMDARNELVAHAPVVVIALGSALKSIDQISAIPLDLTVGQSTQMTVSPSASSASIRAVLSGPRSIFPASENVHTVSASYRDSKTSNEVLPQDDTANLEGARAVLSPALNAALTPVSSQTAIRANTPDRLPLIGQVPDLQAMADQYQGLARNANMRFTEPGSYLDGLYITAGHGSTGVATTALAGEYLASLICNEALPVQREVMELLNPSRFLIRNLKRQKLRQN